MAGAWRAWNRIVLTVAFASWAFVLWRSEVSNLDTFVLFHVDTTPITVYWFSRVFISLALILAYQFFYRHCVLGQREERVHIAHRG